MAYVGLSATLAATGDAVLSHVNGGLRCMVVVLGALMVAAGAAVVLLAWSFS